MVIVKGNSIYVRINKEMLYVVIINILIKYQYVNITFLIIVNLIVSCSHFTNIFIFIPS